MSSLGSALFLCDPHGDDRTHDEGMGWRKAELRRVLVAVLAFVAANVATIRVVVIPGDLFHSNASQPSETTRPSPWVYTLLNWFFAELRKLGVQVRVLPGNHDADPPNGVGPLQALSLDANELVTEPRVETFGGYLTREFELLFLPWFSPAQFAALRPDLARNEQHAMMADIFRDLVLAKLATRDVNLPLVAVTHFTIAGSDYNSGVQPVLGQASEFMVPRNVFPADISLVVSGHIHKPQTLSHIEGYADVVYPGSAIRHDFGEEGEPRRALLVRFDGHHVEDIVSEDVLDIPLPATEFVTLPVTDETNPVSFGALTGKIVRLKGELPAGPETSAFLAKFREALRDAGALKVAKDAITFTRHEHRAVSTITTSTSPDDALVEYMDVVGGEYAANTGELLAIHDELMKEVSA